MDDINILTKLRDMGLNSYETKLWVALLSSRGLLTAGELSDITNVPRSRSYDVLESLRKKGFAFVESEKPVRYKAVSPEEAIKNIKERVKEGAEKQIKLIDELKTKDLFKELEKIYEQSSGFLDSEEFIGFFKDKKNIKNQIHNMIKNTKKSVYIAETTKGLNSNINFLTKILPILEKKKIDVKVMANIGKNTDQKPKIKIKNTKLLNRFYIVDGKDMIFMLFDNYDVGVLVNMKPFIKSITNLFNKQWLSSDFVD